MTTGRSIGLNNQQQPYQMIKSADQCKIIHFNFYALPHPQKVLRFPDPEICAVFYSMECNKFSHLKALFRQASELPGTKPNQHLAMPGQENALNHPALSDTENLLNSAFRQNVNELATPEKALP
jgi:hypothetical protein